MNSYHRDTKEFVAVNITRDGVPITYGVSFSIVAHGLQPGVFSAGVIIGSQVGFMVDNMAPGTYSVWIKVQDVTEIPVFHGGIFRVV